MVWFPSGVGSRLILVTLTLMASKARHTKAMGKFLRMHDILTLHTVCGLDICHSFKEKIKALFNSLSITGGCQCSAMNLCLRLAWITSLPLKAKVIKLKKVRKSADFLRRLDDQVGNTGEEQWQGCISCGIVVSGTRARGVSSEHMENMEMFSCSPT